MPPINPEPRYQTTDGPRPTKLEMQNGQLIIEWNDGQLRSYSPHELREHCPCATCREKRSMPPPPANILPVLSPAEARPLAIAQMKPVGNYAYAINFSDGHDTGIYTLELLRSIGTEVSK
jgi:DUF971 family protein